MYHPRFLLALLAAAVLSATNAPSVLAADLDSDYSGSRNQKQYRSNAGTDSYGDDDLGRYDARDDRRHGGRQFARPHRVSASASYSNDYLPYFVKERRAGWAAISAWNRKVENRFGNRFANWRSAEGKRINCEGAAGSVYCTASAVPARGWSRWGWYGGGRRYD